MSKKDKNKNKQKQQGIPLNRSRLIVGGEQGDRDDGRGRRLKRAIRDTVVAGKSVSHIVNTFSVHGELFGTSTPKWQEDFVKPLQEAIYPSIRPILKTNKMVVMAVIMDRDSFESGLKTLIDRINKRVYNSTSEAGHPVRRVITYGYHLIEAREWGTYVVGDDYEYCIIACLPGALNLPAVLPYQYTEFYLRVGRYKDIDPLMDDEGLEFERHVFEEFTGEEEDSGQS